MKVLWYREKGKALVFHPSEAAKIFKSLLRQFKAAVCTIRVQEI
jgi:hypothetical protein